MSLINRLGKGADQVATTNVRLHAYDLYNFQLSEDSLPITGGDPSLVAAARDRNQHTLEALSDEEFRGCGISPYHLQTSNSFHSNLNNWIKRFNGVPTKHLKYVHNSVNQPFTGLPTTNYNIALTVAEKIDNEAGLPRNFTTIQSVPNSGKMVVFSPGR